MSVITKVLKQTAVYWPPDGLDAFGRILFGTPVQVKCRWDGVLDKQVYNGTGAPQLVDGSTFVPTASIMVDRDMATDGMLCLGTLEEFGDSNPKELDGAVVIRQFQKIPNLRATEFVRIAIA